MASGAELMDLTAMTLATVDKQGRPSARVVLLKGVDQRGFVFFTNYDSRKGQELAENPQAALVFYWSDQERQVCIAGEVSKLPPAEIGCVFQDAAAREPRGGLGLEAKRDRSGPGGTRREVEASGGSGTRPGSPPTAVLGRVPADSHARGVLARATQPTPRPLLLRPAAG